MGEFQDTKDVIVEKKHDQWSEKLSRVTVAHRTCLTTKGDMAWELMNRFGTIAAKPDGEDSTGRSRLGLLSPSEVAERACDIAEIAWNEFVSRGWMQSLPAIESLNDDANKDV